MVRMWCMVEGVSALVNVVVNGCTMWCKKGKWILLRFLIWETYRLVGQDTFDPKQSVPHKFGLTALYNTYLLKVAMTY